MVAASTVLGAAGEHYVMSVLLRHGYIAALAPANVHLASATYLRKLKSTGALEGSTFLCFRA
jgi:hypothetical protein